MTQCPYSRSFHQVPAILQGVRRGDLGGGVLPVLHRRHTDRTCHSQGVALNTRSSRLGAHPLEIARPARKLCGRLAPRGHGHHRSALRMCRVDVTDGHQFDAGNGQQDFPMRHALATHPHKSDAHDVNGRRGERTPSPGTFASVAATAGAGSKPKRPSAMPAPAAAPLRRKLRRDGAGVELGGSEVTVMGIEWQ